MNDVLISIAKMEVNGKRLELPKDEQFANYAAVKKTLINAGGKYSKCGFIFEDAQAIRDSLLLGDVIHDKKKFQFFATPDELAIQMVEMADLQPHHNVLEPSAGDGALLLHIVPLVESYTCIELMPQNFKILKTKGYSPMRGDFLEFTPEDFKPFDRIIANPPFTKNKDIEHILHMFEFIKPGGRIVTLASKSWTFGSQKKQVEFRNGLEFIGADIKDVPAGTFKESGTNIATVLITIDKPL